MGIIVKPYTEDRIEDVLRLNTISGLRRNGAGRSTRNT